VLIAEIAKTMSASNSDSKLIEPLEKNLERTDNRAKTTLITNTVHCQHYNHATKNNRQEQVQHVLNTQKTPNTLIQNTNITNIHESMVTGLERHMASPINVEGLKVNRSLNILCSFSRIHIVLKILRFILRLIKTKGQIKIAGITMICIDRVFSYSGASARVIVETLNDTVCREILNILERGDFSKALKLIESHGGCRILSDKPLKAISGDGQIILTAEPVNLLARISWGVVISKAKEYCRY